MEMLKGLEKILKNLLVITKKELVLTLLFSNHIVIINFDTIEWENEADMAPEMLYEESIPC